MARMAVNPTRMELTRLKARLKTARRGHKLLKDKRDELMKQFLEIVRENKALRRKVEKSLEAASRSFSEASAFIHPQFLRQAFMLPKQQVYLDMSFRNIMSVNVPVYQMSRKTDDSSDIFPYGFAETSGEIDRAVFELNEILPDLIKLSQIEKSVQLMSIEIEKTRRRVSALEFVMIPQLEETIKYITMKLDENERGNLSRLMKVKDMMVEQRIAAERLQNNF